MAGRRAAETVSANDGAFDTDVLIVGAGPTGLTLARELHSLGVAAQIIDGAPDAVHESRALAIQARTLEVLARNRLADDLVTAGNPSGTLLLHESGSASPARAHAVSLVESAVGDTRFPFLLFLSQAATERILVDRLASAGVGIRRGLTLTGLAQDPAGVTATLESPGAPPRLVRARYVVGCDGAHSTTRRLAGIDFAGLTFPQRFLLADVEVDGLEHDRVHVYLAKAGPMFLFPLGGQPATWRLLVQLPRSAPAGPVTLTDAQAAVARHTREPLVVHDPAWMTEFTVSSRLAAAFRRGRVFLAGDAAHIHSPAGAQGMNTGIQDAVNLGWKLALVCRGDARPALLGTYQRERMPVARAVLARTDRAFRVATAQIPLLRSLRAALVPRVGAMVLRNRLVRRAGFRVISELNIHYRHSPLSRQGPSTTDPSAGGLLRLNRGPRPGDRFPQIALGAAPVSTHGTAGVRNTLVDSDRASRPPVFRLLLCGPSADWSGSRVQAFQARWDHLLTVDLIPSAPRSRWSAVPRAAGASRRRPGPAQYLVRWDGYVGYRSAGTDLDGATAYLQALGARPLTA